MKHFDLFISYFTYNGFTWTNTWFSFSFSGIRSYIRGSGSGITYQSNLFCLFIGIGSCLYILILYSIELPFCSCCAAPYLRGSHKCLNHICCDVHEWFRILQWFPSLDCWRWSHFTALYKYFCFTNYYYPRHVMVRGYLDYKIKPDYRAGLDK